MNVDDFTAALPPGDLWVFGYRSLIWSREDRTYIFVAPEGGPDMTRAIRYVMQEAH